VERIHRLEARDSSNSGRLGSTAPSLDRRRGRNRSLRQLRSGATEQVEVESVRIVRRDGTLAGLVRDSAHGNAGRGRRTFYFLASSANHEAHAREGGAQGELLVPEAWTGITRAIASAHERKWTDVAACRGERWPFGSDRAWAGVSLRSPMRQTSRVV